jgi:hypothetical protein
MARPVAKARPPAEFSRSVTPPATGSATATRVAAGYSAAIAFSTNIFLSKSSATLPSLASCSATSIVA